MVKLNVWHSLPFLVVVPGKWNVVILVSYKPDRERLDWMKVIRTVQIFINPTLPDCLSLVQLVLQELCVNHGWGLWFWASQRVTETKAWRDAAGGREVSHKHIPLHTLLFKCWICSQLLPLSNGIHYFSWCNNIQIIPMMSLRLF